MGMKKPRIDKTSPNAKKTGLFKTILLWPLHLLARLGKVVFGQVQVSYQGPGWLTKGVPRAVGFMGKQLRRLFHFKGISPAAAAVKAGSMVLVLALLVVSGLWIFQDRSGFTHITVMAPPPTPLEKDSHYSVLDLVFSNSAARIDLADKTIGEGITLEPPIKGVWKWQGADQLIFSPSEDWSCDTAYRVTMKPSLFLPDLKLDSTTVEFRTAPFTAQLEDVRFQVDPGNDRDRRVWATVVFNYPVDPATIKNQIELKSDDSQAQPELRNPPVEVSFDEFQGKAFLKSGLLPIPKDKVLLQLTVKNGIKIKSGARSLKDNLVSPVTVPGIYDKVWYGGLTATVVRNDNYEYEQILNLDLSGEALPDKVASAAEAWLLPQDRLGVAGLPDDKKHRWSVEEIDQTLLKKSLKVELKPLPTEHNSATLVSFKFKAPPGRVLYVALAGNVPAYGGFIIKEPMKTVLTVPAIPRSLDIMHSGSILSLSGDKTISVVSNDVATVKFRVSRLFPDQVNHLIAQTYGPFSNPQFKGEWVFSDADMSTVYEDVRDLPPLPPGQAQYQSFSFAGYLDHAAVPQEKHGLFLLNVSEYNKETKEEFGRHSRRFILVTDLGMLAKRNFDQTYEVFVQDIRTGSPRANATVEVLGRNGVPVFTQNTDADGRVHVPNLTSFTREKQPVVFTVKSNGDMSFLPLNREDRYLEFSRFDVGGEKGASDPDKVTAYLFSDRGLYRPGDKINVGFIVRTGDWKRNIEGLPLEMKIFDPRGVEVQKTPVKVTKSGLDEMTYKTFETSTSGTWRFELSQVREDKSRVFLGNTTVRVEDFIPDRLTVSSHIEGSDDRAWVPFSALKAQVHMVNLYGTPAAGNEVKAGFRLQPQVLTLPKFADYRFDDAFKSDKFYEETLATATTDEKGNADFKIDLAKFAPATFQLIFTAEGQEKQGGRGVTTESSVVVSPLEWIAGWKSDGRLDYIAKSAVRKINLVAVDPLQNAVAVQKLNYVLDEVRYVSVLTKQEDGSYRYQSVQKKVRVDTGLMDLPASGREVILNTSNPGDYEWSLLDTDGRVAAKVAYSVIGKGNLTRSLDRNAELQIKLNKADYEPGEEVEVQIKAPYAGAGLITIEREKVYASQWFRTDSNASIQRIRIPGDLEGSAYINVSFVRALDSPEIYMSPLSYGVKPFRVRLSKRVLDVKLNTVDEAKPGQPFEIKYSTDRPSKIVIFAVDEGILQLARYQNPRPLDFFFKKRALEVSTSQILDMILPEFSLVEQLRAMGGDADLLRNRLNPFKRKQHEPVAFWSGILDAGPQERSVKYTVPSYFNGTIRILAVAVTPDAVGTFEKRALLRNDFVLSPTLPQFVAPGDSFLMGVTVSNNAKLKMDEPEISVKVWGQDGLSVEGEGEKKLRLARNSEGVLWFRIKAGAQPGAGTIHFQASSGGLVSDLEEGLSIRPSVPWREKIDSGRLSGGTQRLELPRQLLPQFKKNLLTVSFRPSAFNTGLLGYLSDYPYGCSEQVISKAFPALILSGLPGTSVNGKKMEASVGEAVKILSARQNGEGGIGLWAASENADPFVTVYAAHFLTVAGSRGFKSGEPVREALVNYLYKHMGTDGELIEHQPLVAAYAAWVLALNGIVSTNLVLDVRKSLEKQGGDWRKNPAVLFLAGAFSLLKQQSECDQILGDYGSGTKPSDEDRYYDSALYRAGLQVYMNANYRTGGAALVNAELLDRMVSLVGENGFSTLSSVWAVLAFQAYGDRAPLVTPDRVQVVGLTRAGQDKKLTVGQGASVEISLPDDLSAVTVKDNGGAPLYWQTVQTGFDTQAGTKPTLSGLEVYKEFQDEKGQVVTSAKRGQTLTAVVKIRSTDKKQIDQVAVVDLLPGGVELALDQKDNLPFGELLQGNMLRDYAEAREDRLIVYGTIKGDLTEFRYPVKTVTAGIFVLPVLSAEAMYDRTRRGESSGGTFTITE